MNFLAHLALARDQPLARVGQLAADFLRGSVAEITAGLPADMRDGILAHREIDRFTDSHPVFRASVRRLAPASRHASGIAVDLAYDHYLSRHWSRFFPDIARRAFIDRCYRELEIHAALLPPRLAAIVPYLVADDWVGSYVERDGLTTAITRLARRLRRPDLLLASIDAIDRSYAALENDFLRFFPELRAFARSSPLELGA